MVRNNELKRLKTLVILLGCFISTMRTGYSWFRNINHLFFCYFPILSNIFLIYVSLSFTWKRTLLFSNSVLLKLPLHQAFCWKSEFEIIKELRVIEESASFCSRSLIVLWNSILGSWIPRFLNPFGSIKLIYCWLSYITQIIKSC